MTTRIDALVAVAGIALLVFDLTRWLTADWGILFAVRGGVS
jgi:hypothetical protein